MSRRMVVVDHRETEDESSKDGGEEEEEYEVQDLRDRIKSSRGSQFNLIKNELGLGDGSSTWRRRFSHRILLTVYSSFFTPFEFGFFRGLGERLFILDVVGQVTFLVDIVLQFFIAYRDSHTYRMVYKRNWIALRYLKSSFIIDLLGCMPWDHIYKACGRREEVRYLLWIRLCRVRKVTRFFHDLEKGICINYLFTRIIKLIVVELYCTHTAACIFYYLATTLPASQEGYTWIGSLKLGDYSYSSFRDIDLWKRYASLYFATGYGDIHAVNLREMIFIMGYVSFNMILRAYLIGNMTALIVKGSKTEKFRDKMTDLIKYMNRNRLGKDIHNQIKGHLRLKYESTCTEAAVLQEIPASIRSKISQTLYFPYIESVPLFKGCLTEFINRIVIKLHEEFFSPWRSDHGTRKVVFCLKGHLAALKGHEDITLFLIQEGVDINIKDNFGNTPLLEAIKNRNDRVSSLLIQQGASLNIDNAGSFICTSIARGDADLLKRLLAYGIDPNSKDYDHRTPLHVAASEGLFIMAKLLLEAGASVFSKDRWGNTPLDEGRMCGNKNLIKLLEEAKAAQLTEFPYCAQEITDKMHPKKCTVYPFHPWESREGRRPGIVLWVPSTIGELIGTAGEQLEFSSSGSGIILTEDAGKILDVDLINDGQKLYLVSETHFT
ncbi:hypothetical protein EV1_046739 [Malus domestica]